MPQLARTTFHSASLRYLRWPYQAKVIKMLETASRTMVRKEPPDTGKRFFSAVREFRPGRGAADARSCIDSSVEHQPVSGRKNQKRRTPRLMNGERSDLLRCGRR